MSTHRKRTIETRIVNPLLGDQIPLPSYATDGSAALDLRACIEAPHTLEPGQRALFPTGLAIDIGDPNWVAIVASRSGLSLKHGLRVAQGIGVIDSDYHGEIGVILANDGEAPYVVSPGERIAQLLVQPVVQVELTYVEAFSTATERGSGGFGHSGQH
ncbi:deoxyuridine 5'-triphosphate nucleotidohydrolase [Halorhodospira abdelmalekii]|uniref:dUTP diphosphatase n=1 Tax=Halorhodospira abdelmalekii TaxID=421629 RepID=UPI0019035F6D|nr:dUTP diphosphatase [Halorhodospira abdelmalekii]MBK1734417.1 deoxyuridine 5'-triphosphate nucleotidohydrolase [Halorhodospira abdelmalekii]